MTSRLPCRPYATRTYRERVIEARFDDLTGAEPSFRLVGPAGVLEARRPDEVPGVLAAAEQAAARSLWVAGFITYEAAPGLDRSLEVHARPSSGPFADLPLAWFAMFEGREETSLPEPPESAAESAAEPVADPATAWRPAMTRRDYDAAVDRIHRAIAAGDTYQVNLTMPLEAEFAAIPGACIAIFPTRSAAHTAPTSTRGRTASCRPRPSSSSGSTRTASSRSR